VISARGLTRLFDGRPAVDHVSFEVPDGQVFTLLGPNGAGKTTTVRMLLGLIAPSAGGGVVAGQPLGGGSESNRTLRARCGLLTETPGFYDRLSARENLLFFGRLYGLTEPLLGQRIEHYLRLFDLWDRRQSPVGTYSKGMKQRLALARALFHDPKVVFLDEPTAGLDPEATLAVREMILGLKREGRTLLVCTHNLDEAERLADIVGILKQRLLACDTLTRLRAGGDGQRLVIRLDAAAAPHAAALRTVTGVQDVTALEATLELALADAAATSRVVQLLVQRGAGVLEVRPGGASLESIYLQAVREDA
jgi:ABC-2 type transport system ATP-binding protein